MTLQEFKEDYDGCPYDLEEFAISAAIITDDLEFANAAKNYLIAKDIFFEKLTKEIELG